MINAEFKGYVNDEVQNCPPNKRTTWEEIMDFIVNSKRKIAHEREEIASNYVGIFIDQCGEMAEKNWCPAQVEMLERLFGAVLHGVDYADYEVNKK